MSFDGYIVSSDETNVGGSPIAELPIPTMVFHPSIDEAIINDKSLRSSKTKDPAWKFGIRTDIHNPNYVKCLLCSKTYKGGIGRMKSHLSGILDGSLDVMKCPSTNLHIIREISDYLESQRVEKKRKERAKGVEVEINHVCSQPSLKTQKILTSRSGVGLTSGSIQPLGPLKLKPKENLYDIVRERKLSKKKPLIEQAMRKQEKKMVDEICAEFFYSCAIPFNAATKPSLDVLFEVVGRYIWGYIAPSIYQLYGPLLQTHVTNIDELCKVHEVHWKLKGCTLMYDGWTDCHGRSLINFLVHSTEGPFYLYSVDASSKEKTTQYIAETLEAAINTIGAENVIQTIESSSEENQGEDVALSQLNLIDLAGSESSKTETTGLRRKEGSYINKSLLTLGTVIAKLTDGKSAHVPYRDSKLTRLLQSSLSGHGRVSIICTVTPASSNTEETHNTIKFAHRSKHVEIKAAQNKILDEKSLIKKYQKEISSLKNELQHLKHGMMEKHYLVTPDQEDLVNLKMQLEAGQVKLQSRLEEEEQAKEALMGRIQRLTKLILVSTKNTISSNIPERANYRRTHSFCEDELAYLPDTKQEYIIDDDTESLDSELSSDGSIQFDKRNKKRGMLGWFKMKNPDADHNSSANVSPSCPQSSQHNFFASDGKLSRRKSVSKRGDVPSSGVDSFPGRSQAGDLFSAAVRSQRPPPTGTTITDQMELLREQVKMLAEEVALCTSSQKRLSEQAAKNPEDLEIQVQMQRLKDEISEKRLQMHVLEQRMIGSFERSQRASNILEMSQAVSKLAAQLNEKTFELEIMSADNRILQEQLQLKVSENTEIQETAVMLRHQIDLLLDSSVDDIKQTNKVEAGQIELEDEACFSGTAPKSLYNQPSLKSQVLMQAAEIENLKQENLRVAEEKEGFEIRIKKLSEEASYAKELASAAAVELRNLAEEVTKLSYHNAKLTAETSLDAEILEKDKRVAELQSIIEESKRREEDLENELASMGVLVAKMKIPERSKETVYEEVSSQLHSSGQNGSVSCNGLCSRKCKDQFYTDKNGDGMTILEELQTAYESERKRSEELESTISKLKSEDLSGLDVVSLDELQNFHVNALSKIRLTKLMNDVL